jgi:hypothetical protein
VSAWSGASAVPLKVVRSTTKELIREEVIRGAEAVEKDEARSRLPKSDGANQRRTREQQGDPVRRYNWGGVVVCSSTVPAQKVAVHGWVRFVRPIWNRPTDTGGTHATLPI